MSRRRALWVAALLLGLAGAAVAFAAHLGWRRLHEPYKAYGGDLKVVEVPAGASARSILDRLAAEGVVRDPLLTRIYFTYYLESPVLQAGEYAFTKPLTAAQVIDKLRRGDVLLHQVTLVEGLTLTESASHLAAKGFGEYAELLDRMSSPELIRDLDPLAETLEGYLFPDTYAFARHASESQIVARLVATFRRRFEEEVRPALATDGSGDEVRRLVTLASIIEKEAQIDEERPLIAAVYVNRLERGIGLFADPTVIYALKQLGRWDGNLRRADLELDHPYNTYRHAGLPPGPIGSPGLASLLAAASPAEVPYLYFVSRNDGSHVFASTLSEHNRNVDRWQRQYWRQRWAQQRPNR